MFGVTLRSSGSIIPDPALPLGKSAANGSLVFERPQHVALPQAHAYRSTPVVLSGMRKQATDRVPRGEGDAIQVEGAAELTLDNDALSAV